MNNNNNNNKSSPLSDLDGACGTLHETNSALFEVKSKPKLTCIPQLNKQKDELRKTQSLIVPNAEKEPEQSWSVLYVGARYKVNPNLFMPFERD